jgi:hypothetical protein
MKGQKTSMSTLKPLAPHGAVCYFLGAGFSAAVADLPTSVGFLTTSFKYDDSVAPGVALYRDAKFETFGRDREYAALFEYIEKQFGPLQDQNIEAVMTDLHVRAFGLGRAWEESSATGDLNRISVEQMQRAYYSLLSYIRLRLLFSRVLATSPLGAKWASSLLSQDSVLTLNYDTVVEDHLALNRQKHAPLFRQIWCDIAPLSLGYGQGTPILFRGPTRHGEGVFAKLHGSVDWITCGNADCPHFRQIQSFSPWYEECRPRLSENEGSRLRCAGCGWAPNPVIVPPIAAKGFTEFPRLNTMWLRAFNALCHSQRWVFVGVSFAETDFHLASLLRSVPRTYCHVRHHGGLCIVDPNADSVAKRLVGSLNPEMRRDVEGNVAKFASLDDYLEMSGGIDTVRTDGSTS